jgi:hypothetical protein
MLAVFEVLPREVRTNGEQLMGNRDEDRVVLLMTLPILAEIWFYPLLIWYWIRCHLLKMSTYQLC